MIERLRLKFCFKLTAIGLLLLFQSCNRLKLLDLSGIHVMNDLFINSLCQSAMLHSLEWLEMAMCPLLTDSAVLQVVNSFSRLKRLNIADCKKISEQIKEYVKIRF